MNDFKIMFDWIKSIFIKKPKTPTSLLGKFAIVEGETWMKGYTTSTNPFAPLYMYRPIESGRYLIIEGFAYPNDIAFFANDGVCMVTPAVMVRVE